MQNHISVKQFPSIYSMCSCYISALWFLCLHCLYIFLQQSQLSYAWPVNPEELQRHRLQTAFSYLSIYTQHVLTFTKLRPRCPVRWQIYNVVLMNNDINIRLLQWIEWMWKVLTENYRDVISCALVFCCSVGTLGVWQQHSAQLLITDSGWFIPTLHSNCREGNGDVLDLSVSYKH